MPYFVKVGTPSFRRWVMSVFPSEDVRRMQYIVDNMYQTSQEVLESKKKLVAKGDTELMHEVGYGKDIMSVLRMFTVHKWNSSLSSFQCAQTWLLTLARDLQRMKFSAR